MKFKLDENLSRRAAELIRSAGHDGITLASQGPRGAADETLFEVCMRESRALVTLDRVRELLTSLDTRSPEGALWIVEPGRLRIHLPADDAQ